jgi:AraC family ethanolamine operon transcriptional activator
MLAAIGFVHSIRSSNIDELLQATRGWDLDFRQLDSGISEAQLEMIVLTSARLMRFRFNHSFHQQGATIKDFRTFGFIEEGVSDVRWYGREIDDSTILSFHPAGEFEAVASSRFHGFTLSYDEQQLADITEVLRFSSLDTALGRSEMTLTNARSVAALRNRLRHMFAAIAKKPSLLEFSAIINDLENEMPAQLLSVLTTSSENERRPSIRARDRALKLSLSFIDEKAHKPPTVMEICRASGVSWRTLNYAFREHFGITPKRYLIITRLNAVRKELLAEKPAISVVSAASRWGFWHIGQFAADYQRRFGELPSQTLTRKRNKIIL